MLLQNLARYFSRSVISMEFFPKTLKILCKVWFCQRYDRKMSFKRRSCFNCRRLIRLKVNLKCKQERREHIYHFPKRDVCVVYWNHINTGLQNFSQNGEVQSYRQRKCPIKKIIRWIFQYRRILWGRWYCPTWPYLSSKYLAETGKQFWP